MAHTYSANCPDCGGGYCQQPLPCYEASTAAEGGGETQEKRRRLVLNRHVDSTVMPIQATLQVTLWNIANLGGGFGFPAVRDYSVIFAIAAVLHQARSGIYVVL